MKVQLELYDLCPVCNSPLEFMMVDGVKDKIAVIPCKTCIENKHVMLQNHRCDECDSDLIVSYYPEKKMVKIAPCSVCANELKSKIKDLEDQIENWKEKYKNKVYANE